MNSNLSFYTKCTHFFLHTRCSHSSHYERKKTLYSTHYTVRPVCRKLSAELQEENLDEMFLKTTLAGL